MAGRTVGVRRAAAPFGAGSCVEAEGGNPMSFRTAWLLAPAAAALAGAFVRSPVPPPPAANPPDAGKVALFDGKSLAGWKLVLEDPKADPARTWSVSDGVIHCTGTPAGYLRTEKSFRDYLLVVEWRWPAQAGNSGVLLHMQRDDKVWPYSVEAQLHSGNAGDFWLIDGATAKVDDSRRNPGARINVKHLQPAEKPLGEWNRYEITCIDSRVVLVVNGELVNVARDAVPNEGFICLQSEGAPIEFRKVELTPIP
jgi:hypothetical protein